MRYVIEWDGGEWITREEAIKLAGISESEFDRLSDVGILVAEEVNKRNIRFNALEVLAAVKLWPQLRKLLDLQTPSQDQKSGKS